MLENWLGRSQDLTTRDMIAGIPFVFSGFLCFLLILAYFVTHTLNPVIFAVSILICLISFAFVRSRNRKPMMLTLVVFFAIRLVWSLLIMVLSAM
jgi:hypothetical protein